ncbi:hypothetical protein ACWDHW_08295 [Streptomyces melanosporofaciens]
MTKKRKNDDDAVVNVASPGSVVGVQCGDCGTVVTVTPSGIVFDIRP